MAERKQLWHPDEVKKKAYVYRVFDGHETVYVGKGTGSRLKRQMKAFSLQGEIIEVCNDDDHAFLREKYWISQLRPTANKMGGGNGGRSMPRALSTAEKKSHKEYKRFLEEYQEVGPRRYSARYILSKINDFNANNWNVSKLELSRLREVANGSWC